MELSKFEALVVEFKKTQCDELLEQIADIHTTDPEKYEPIMNKHKVTY